VTADDELLAAMEANLASHLAHLPRHLAGALVLDEPDLLLVDSGVPSDTFNAVCHAYLDGADADGRIAGAIQHFRTRRLPFSWWVGPTSRPDDLGERLIAHGLALAEAEVAMALNLCRAPEPAAVPPDLEIRVAATRTDLLEYAAAEAANWDPPDGLVLEVFARAAAGTLGPGSPARYHIGHVGGRPVAASECYLAAGVAGIYGVVTLPGVRRRGYGTALVAAALRTAQAEGYTVAVLQAGAQGLRIYERLGFAPCGEFREYKPLRTLANS
jgi:GNAT superfamily N-acetyltransferase